MKRKDIIPFFSTGFRYGASHMIHKSFRVLFTLFFPLSSLSGFPLLKSKIELYVLAHGCDIFFSSQQAAGDISIVSFLLSSALPALRSCFSSAFACAALPGWKNHERLSESGKVLTFKQLNTACPLFWMPCSCRYSLLYYQKSLWIYSQSYKQTLRIKQIHGDGDSGWKED